MNDKLKRMSKRSSPTSGNYEVKSSLMLRLKRKRRHVIVAKI
jgi:hypothetical protein